MSLGSSNKNLWKGDLRDLRTDLKILIGSPRSQPSCHPNPSPLFFNMTSPTFPCFCSQTHTSHHTVTTRISWTLHLLITDNVISPGLRDTLPTIGLTGWLSGAVREGLTLPAPPEPHKNGNNYSRLKISKRHNNPTQCMFCNWILNLKGHHWIYCILDYIIVYNTHKRKKEKANIAEY